MADSNVTEAELLRRVMASQLDSLHTAMPGKVVSYNASAQTATVLPQISSGGSAPSAIQNVIVAWPRGGDGYLVFPLGAGDFGLLVFCERDLTAWRNRGEATAPGDTSRHGLNSAVFIPGVYPSGNSLPAPVGATVLAGSDVRLGSSVDTQAVLRGLDVYLAIVIWEALVATFLSNLGTWIPVADPTSGTPGSPGANLLVSAASLAAGTIAFRDSVGSARSGTVEVK